MSVALDPLDLSTAQKGSPYTLDWTGKIKSGAPVGVVRGRPTLRMFNESGVGLKYTLGIRSDRIPAGGWVDVQLNGENFASFVVEYTLPGQPVSLLLGTIYELGEPIPPIPTLGNSPIGVGGQVATSGTGGTDHILNTGNAPATSTYTTTPSDQSGSSIADTNDGAGYRKILSANVLRTVWNIVRGNATTGKAAVTIGDSGDTTITTFYGTVGAGSTVPTSVVTGTLPVGQVGSGYPGGNVSGAVASATSASQLTTGAGQFTAIDDGTVVHVRVSGLSGGRTIRFEGWNGSTQTAGLDIRTDASIAFANAGSLTGIYLISGSGSATVNHGLTATPNAALVNTNNGSNSTTYGSGSYTSSTVYIYQFNAQPWTGLVYKS